MNTESELRVICAKCTWKKASCSYKQAGEHDDRIAKFHADIQSDRSAAFTEGYNAAKKEFTNVE